jgi:hypothetical protein
VFCALLASHLALTIASGPFTASALKSVSMDEKARGRSNQIKFFPIGSAFAGEQKRAPPNEREAAILAPSSPPEVEPLIAAVLATTTGSSPPSRAVTVASSLFLENKKRRQLGLCVLHKTFVL